MLQAQCLRAVFHALLTLCVCCTTACHCKVCLQLIGARLGWRCRIRGSESCLGTHTPQNHHSFGQRRWRKSNDILWSAIRERNPLLVPVLRYVKGTKQCAWIQYPCDFSLSQLSGIWEGYINVYGIQNDKKGHLPVWAKFRIRLRQMPRMLVGNGVSSGCGDEKDLQIVDD